MTNRPPPAPPENRSPKGPGEAAGDNKPGSAAKPPPRENLAEQGRQGNIKQNTTNQGHQQDR